MQELGFSNQTSLWYYILDAAQACGTRLGEVGVFLVAEVLIGHTRHSENSIFNEDEWKPTLGSEPAKF